MVRYVFLNEFKKKLFLSLLNFVWPLSHEDELGGYLDFRSEGRGFDSRSFTNGFFWWWWLIPVACWMLPKLSIVVTSRYLHIVCGVLIVTLSNRLYTYWRLKYSNNLYWLTFYKLGDYCLTEPVLVIGFNCQITMGIRQMKLVPPLNY